MWQLELANVPVEGWVIYSDVNCFFNVPGNTVVFPSTILKLSRETSWPVVFWWPWWVMVLLCSLYLSPNVLPDSPMYSSSQSTLPHLYLYITLLFLSMVSLSLGCTRRSLIVLPPVKYTSTPYLLQMFLQVSPRPFMYGTTMYDFLVLLFLWLFSFCFFLMFVLFQAHKGICIFSGHYTDGLLLLLVTVWWNIQFLPCD